MKRTKENLSIGLVMLVIEKTYILCSNHPEAYFPFKWYNIYHLHGIPCPCSIFFN